MAAALDDSTDQPLATADAVLGAPDARSTSLDFPGGATATVTHSDSLGKAVLVTEQMPPPPEGKVYQLWLDQPGEGMVSAGVMPSEADQTVRAEGDATTATGGRASPSSPKAAPTSPDDSTPIALFDFGTEA